METQVDSTSETQQPPVEVVAGESVPVKCSWRTIVRSGDKSIQFQGAPSVTATVQRGVIGEDFLWGLKTIGAPACLQRVRHHYDVAQLKQNKRRVLVTGGNRMLELLFTADPPPHLIYALEDVFSRHTLPGTKLAQMRARVARISRHMEPKSAAPKEVRQEAWRQRTEETKMKRREKALRRATALARVAKKYL